MITQYSRVQLTLSEKEKEYAWFSYAAKIIRAGCNDQQMSGYTVTGTGTVSYTHLDVYKRQYLQSMIGKVNWICIGCHQSSIRTM